MSLSEFHEWVREVVRSACEEALQDENFVPDPINDEEDGEGIDHYVWQSDASSNNKPKAVTYMLSAGSSYPCPVM